MPHACTGAHEVRRPFRTADTLRVIGELVHPSGWRNGEKLISGRFLSETHVEAPVIRCACGREFTSELAWARHGCPPEALLPPEDPAPPADLLPPAEWPRPRVPAAPPPDPIPEPDPEPDLSLAEDLPDFDPEASLEAPAEAPPSPARRGRTRPATDSGM